MAFEKQAQNTSTRVKVDWPELPMKGSEAVKWYDELKIAVDLTLQSVADEIDSLKSKLK